MNEMVSNPLGASFNDSDYAPHSNYPDLVFCFDRDHTISVSPPPASHGLAVPLAWVRYLAHDDDTRNIDVWATGNQRLRHEAMVPGFREALASWEQFNQQSAFDTYNRIFHDDRKPQRRDGLRLVADLYRNSTQHAASTNPVPDNCSPPPIAVIDDADLHDLATEGFEYYHPDIFTTLVESTNGTLELFDTANLSLPLEHLPPGFTKGDSPASANSAYSNAAFGFNAAPDSYANDCIDASNADLIATHFDPSLE